MPRNPAIISRLRARPLNAPMTEPFEIASGSRLRVENVLIEVRLADGTRGFGECAPFSGINDEDQASALKASQKSASFVEGKDAAKFLQISRLLEERLEGHGSVRAGIEMAVLDAWTKQRRMPLWVYFGGAGSRLRTDVTVTILPPAAARLAARRIVKRGISELKIKVGKSIEDDVERVRIVSQEAPKGTFIVDANEGYNAKTALEFLRRLKRLGIRPVLFEQPVPRKDWDGLEEILRKGGVPVAADESVTSRKDALKIARLRSASVINIKLMKYGIAEAWDVARIARAAGLGLMIGGMVESTLAMGCAAHFAAGFGGFRYIDLDTPLWFSKNPMRGLNIGPGGVYDLAKARAGIGVSPKNA